MEVECGTVYCVLSGLRAHNERSFIRSFEKPEKIVQVHLIQQRVFLK